MACRPECVLGHGSLLGSPCEGAWGWNPPAALRPLPVGPWRGMGAVLSRGYLRRACWAPGSLPPGARVLLLVLVPT